VAIAAGTERPAANLLLDAFEDDDVRVGSDPDREDEARDPGQRHRDRDQLDEREEVDRVDDERADSNEAEHAVEASRKTATTTKPGDARDQALIQRLLAERRRDLRGGDISKLDRQRARLQQVRQSLARLDRGSRRRCASPGRR
jgi:hypothetical protein